MQECFLFLVHFKFKVIDHYLKMVKGFQNYTTLNSLIYQNVKPLDETKSTKFSVK